jgi:hypothetical protein
MNTFSSQLTSWQFFYSTVAAASATLTGLLFVSLSLNIEKIKSQAGRSMLHTAQRSFEDFLYVLMIALVFLVPHPVPIGLAIALFVLGAARGLGLVRHVVHSRKGGPRRPPASESLREYALPALACLGLIVVGVEILRGDTESIFGLVLVIAALLTSASWNAWLLLVEERRD